MRKIGSFRGTRLQPLAVLILNPCGHAAALNWVKSDLIGLTGDKSFNDFRLKNAIEQIAAGLLADLVRAGRKQP